MKTQCLKPNKRSEFPRKHLVVSVDPAPHCKQVSGQRLEVGLECWRATPIEVRDFEGVEGAALSGIYESEFWEQFESLLSPKNTTWIWSEFAHQTVTLLNFWGMCDAADVVIKAINDSDGAYYITGSFKGLRFVWLDLENWYRDLARTGPGGIEGHSWAIQLVRSLCQFADIMDFGCLRYTVASQSLQCWRHRWGPRVDIAAPSELGTVTAEPVKRTFILPIPHDHAAATAAETDSFFGMAPIVFRIGVCEGPVHHVDVTGFYQSLMDANKFPGRYLGEIPSPTPLRIAELLHHYCVVARVQLKSPERAFPVRVNTHTVLARGNFWTTLCTPEMKEAFRLGYVTKVSEAFIYEPYDLFGAYCEEYRLARLGLWKNPDSHLSCLTKALFNSLHGKFVQRSTIWKDRPKVAARVQWGRWLTIDAETGTVRSFRAISGHVQEQIREGYAPWCCPVVTAHITSAARCGTARLLGLIGPRNCYYQNVDGFHITSEGLARLEEAKLLRDCEVGFLRKVRTFHQVKYYGGARYVADGEECISGLPAGANVVKEDVWQWYQPLSPRATLNDNPGHTIQLHYHQLDLSTADLKYGVDDEGWTIPTEIIQFPVDIPYTPLEEELR